MARNRIARILRHPKVASRKSKSILGTKFSRPPQRSRKASNSTPDDNVFEHPPTKSRCYSPRDPVEKLYLYSLPLRIRAAEQDQDRIGAKLLKKLDKNEWDMQDLIRARARLAFLEAEQDALVYHRGEHDTRPMRERWLGQLALEHEAWEKRWEYAELVGSAPLLRYGATRRWLALFGAMSWTVIRVPTVGACMTLLWMEDRGHFETIFKWMVALRKWRSG